MLTTATVHHHAPTPRPQRLLNPIRFLAKKQALDDKVLDALWGCLEGAAQGDATTRAVFGLVGDLANALTVPQLDRL